MDINPTITILEGSTGVRACTNHPLSQKKQVRIQGYCLSRGLKPLYPVSRHALGVTGSLGQPRLHSPEALTIRGNQHEAGKERRLHRFLPNRVGILIPLWTGCETSSNVELSELFWE